MKPVFIEVGSTLINASLIIRIDNKQTQFSNSLVTFSNNEQLLARETPSELLKKIKEAGA